MASRGDIDKNAVSPRLPKEWMAIPFDESLVNAGDFVKLKSKDFFDDGDYPVIDQGERFISGFINDESLLYKGDLPVIIFGDHTRTIKFVNFRFAVGADGTKILKPKKGLDEKFFYYYLKCLRIPSLGYSRHFKILRSVDVPIPPLPDQQRIVAKLDTLFGHLDQLKGRLEKIPALLKQFRQAVLTQAVTGKLTEEWRAKNRADLRHELNTFKNSREGEYKLFCESRAKQGLTSPKLPDIHLLANNTGDWACTMTVESASLLIIDCLHDTPKFSSIGKYCIDTTCIEPFNIKWECARKVDDLTFSKWTSRLVPLEGDILFSREGTIGTAVKIPSGKSICIGQRMMLFRFPSKILNDYAEIYLNSGFFKAQVNSLITGTTSPHVNIGDLRKLAFIVPSIAEQNEIVRRVQFHLALIDSVNRKYELLVAKTDELPRAILSKALRGDLENELRNNFSWTRKLASQSLP